VNSIDKLGYEPIDEWQAPTRHGRIPCHPEASFPYPADCVSEFEIGEPVPRHSSH
jgi:hypothetical protein